MDNIERKEYMEQLRALKDEQVIKVVTGIRRCGKSTLLEMFRDEIRAQGVSERQITYLNFEDEENERLRDRRSLYQYLADRVISDKMNYVFLDEIQDVPEFERVVDSFFIHRNIDVYITGSNAHLLSSDLATFLSGRYIEVKMLPFSFKEYSETFDNNVDANTRLNDYLAASSFPLAVRFAKTKPEQVNPYVEGIYKSVLQKDIISRKRIGDQRLFAAVTRFAFDVVGSTVSPNSIANAMKQESTSIDSRTVSNYLTALSESFVLYPASRFDVRGKQLLRTREKYYLVDIGLRRVLLGGRPAADIGHLLENVVYLELFRRGNQVYIGKVGSAEVDFVAIAPGGEVSYYQVAYTAKEQSTKERELRPLLGIRDNYPKYLLTTDEFESNLDGIKVLNVAKWLLGKH
jgi:predicted AAA+ superfamily ATPase